MCLVVAALAGGCTVALKIGYNQGPTLLYWWMSGYADFEGAQATRVKQLIEQWFAWNRREQLPDYAQLLERAQTQVLQPVLTPQAMCMFSDEVRQRVRTAFEQAVPSLAEVAITLTPEQLAQMEKKFEKNNRKFRDEFLGDRRDRLKAQAKKVEERLKTVYGSVTDAQHERLLQLLAASPYDPEQWLAERRQLQQELLAQLRQLQQARAAQGDVASQAAQVAQAQAVLRRLGQQAERSAREAYRQQQQRVVDYNCAMAAELHNLATPAQRQAAQRKFERWHEDVQELHRRPPA